MLGSTAAGASAAGTVGIIGADRSESLHSALLQPSVQFAASDTLGSFRSFAADCTNDRSWSTALSWVVKHHAIQISEPRILTESPNGGGAVALAWVCGWVRPARLSVTRSCADCRCWFGFRGAPRFQPRGQEDCPYCSSRPALSAARKWPSTAAAASRWHGCLHSLALV